MMMRLKLLAYACLFAAPVFLAAEIQSLNSSADDGRAIQRRDFEASRRLAEIQSHPDYVPPEAPVIVSMLD